MNSSEKRRRKIEAMEDFRSNKFFSQKFVLTTILLFLISFWPPVYGAPPPVSNNAADQIKTPVGKLFTLKPASTDGNGVRLDPELFPSWCRLNQSNGEIYGIPQVGDVGSHLIITDPKRRTDVKVVNAETWPCQGEQTSIWVEIVDRRFLPSMTPPEQYSALKTIHGILNASGISAVEIGDWRVFPYSWLPHYRNMTARITEPIPGQILPSQAVFVLHLCCGELNDFASDVINALAESGQSFQVIEGLLNVKPQHPIGFATDGSGDEGSAADFRNIALIITIALIVILVIAMALWFAQRWSVSSRKLSKKEESKKLNVSDESGAMLVTSSAPSPAAGTTGTDLSDSMSKTPQKL